MSKIFKIAKVLNEFTIVLNAGSNQGIKENQRFLVYTTDGDEVFDPDTKELLGKLEVVKGTGTVTFLQLKMCTIKSDRSSKYTINDAILSITSDKPNIGDKKDIPFNNPCIGDLVKSV